MSGQNNGGADKFLQLEQDMSKNLILQGEYEQSQEVAMLALKTARKMYFILVLLVVGAIAFVLVFFPIMAYLQFRDVVDLWNKYKPEEAPSGTRLALGLKFPFLSGFFFTIGAFPSAVYIVARSPDSRTAFMTVGTPEDNMAQLWSNGVWGEHEDDPSVEHITTALNIVCNTTWGMTVGECQPVCPPGQGQYASDFVSSGLSMGMTGVMMAGAVAPPFGAIIGGLVGAVIGCTIQGISKATSGSQCKT